MFDESLRESGTVTDRIAYEQNIQDISEIPMSVETPEGQCGGLFFRCKDTQYIGSRGELVFKTVFYPLKKMSCKGCRECWHLQDELNQVSSCDEVQCETIKNNGIYRFDITNISYDRESGNPDDWDLEMVLQN